MARAITRWNGMTIAAKQIVRAHQRRRGDLLPGVARRRDLHDDPEIEMLVVETGHQLLPGRAHHRKQPDDSFCRGLTRRLQAERRDQDVPQAQQHADPARRAAHDQQCRRSRIERRAFDLDAIGVGELRAREQRARLGARRELRDAHAEPNLFASRWKRRISRPA
jgi:hypothetical protein